MSWNSSAYEALPLGRVLPLGWMKDQLRLQADGLTGHLEEHWDDVGPGNGWIGGSGESWERGPYYLDGLVPLAYLLQDERLIAKARRWIEWSLASQREDGSFGPDRIQSVNEDIDKSQDWWHYMIMMKVMIQYEEATGDNRIVPFLIRFFRYMHMNMHHHPLKNWAVPRGAELTRPVRGAWRCVGRERSRALGRKRLFGPGQSRQDPASFHPLRFVSGEHRRSR
ncbi:hypothetical protein [Paenibacillus sp. P22]|uniref:hypothetical protein n=1 Tax=Paenibacillus sp. P22 TaxID=483908 RepID=UPI0004351CE9|nr:hypothetical protein [Paenibacillus sp. P22]CDN41584.1 hypothetical protein BN871_AI_00950 [Paenibacillus sp. P22]